MTDADPVWNTGDGYGADATSLRLSNSDVGSSQPAWISDPQFEVPTDPEPFKLDSTHPTQAAPPPPSPPSDSAAATPSNGVGESGDDYSLQLFSGNLHGMTPDNDADKVDFGAPLSDVAQPLPAPLNAADQGPADAAWSDKGPVEAEPFEMSSSASDQQLSDQQLSDQQLSERMVKVDVDVAYESGLCRRCKPTKPSPWEAGPLFWLQVAFAILLTIIIVLALVAIVLCVRYVAKRRSAAPRHT